MNEDLKKNFIKEVHAGRNAAPDATSPPARLAMPRRTSRSSRSVRRRSAAPSPASKPISAFRHLNGMLSGTRSRRRRAKAMARDLWMRIKCSRPVYYSAMDN